MSPVPSRSRAGGQALASLLLDLGSRIHRGASQETREAPQSLATGLPELDQRLGGGFPRGRLSEICGARSSGRTSLALHLLAETLERGGLGAWIDLADAFDPASAEAGGVALERLLWVRPRRLEEAVRSCERLLQTKGFGLLVFDGSERGPQSPRNGSPAVRDGVWLRLARLASSSRTALVVLSRTPTVGSRAEIVLEMAPLGARFAGPPGLLEALETTAVLRRHRSRPIGPPVQLSISLS